VSARRGPWLAVVALGLALGWNLWAGSLVDSDDALYAQMAREAVASGDWLTFTYHGTPVFEKPPLALWALATSQALLGEGEAALRLPAWLASVATLGLLAWLVRRLAGGGLIAPLGALLALAGSWTFAFAARGSMTDPLFVALGLGALCLALDARAHPGRLLGVGLLLGLALLTKWVMVVVWLPPVAWALLRADPEGRPFPWRRVWAGVALGAVVALPWFVHQTLAHGAAFWDDLFWYHVVTRARSPLVGAIDLSDALADLIEREGLLLLAWLAGLVALVRQPLLGVWAASALVPFLLGSTHLRHYTLPGLPALAAGVGLALARLPRAAALGALVALGALGVWSNAGQLAHPDFSPDERRFGAEVRAYDEARGVGAAYVYNAHDVAISWYAGRPFRLIARDPRLHGILSGIPILARPRLVVPPDQPLASLLAPSGGTAFLVPAPFREAFGAELGALDVDVAASAGRRYDLVLVTPRS